MGRVAVGQTAAGWEERAPTPPSVRPQTGSDSHTGHFPGAGLWQPLASGPWACGDVASGMSGSGGPCYAGWAGPSRCTASCNMNLALERGPGQQQEPLCAEEAGPPGSLTWTLLLRGASRREEVWLVLSSPELSRQP